MGRRAAQGSQPAGLTATAGARTLRELIIPFGTTGYILRFDIRSPGLVLVIGARHQREEDFH